MSETQLFFIFWTDTRNQISNSCIFTTARLTTYEDYLFRTYKTPRTHTRTERRVRKITQYFLSAMLLPAR